VLACPFGVPKMQTEFSLMMKCDMCYDRTSVGNKPMCASVCPSGALWFGRREELAVPHVEARGRVHVPAARVAAKLRYRSAPIPARLVTANGGFVLELEEPAHGVATGQVAALYDGGAVLGAGVITRTA